MFMVELYLRRVTGDDEAAVEEYTKSMEAMYAAARKLKQAQAFPEP